MRVIGVVGWKNNGKTTLVCKLIEHFKADGLRIGTVKHAHHSVDVDQEGKDSFRHRQAGAHDVILATAKRFAHIREFDEGEDEPPLSELLDRLDNLDLIIVEGFKRFPHPKIEVHRAIRGTPLLAAEDATIIGVASDEPLDIPIPVVDLDDIEAVATLVQQHARPHGR